MYTPLNHLIPPGTPHPPTMSEGQGCIDNIGINLFHSPVERDTNKCHRGRQSVYTARWNISPCRVGTYFTGIPRDGSLPSLLRLYSVPTHTPPTGAQLPLGIVNCDNPDRRTFLSSHYSVWDFFTRETQGFITSAPLKYIWKSVSKGIFFQRRGTAPLATDLLTYGRI